MMKTCLCVVVAMVATAAVMVEAGVPNVSCTFTAQMELTAKYNDDSPKHFSYIHYASQRLKAYRQTGLEPAYGFPGNATLIFHSPNKFAAFEPVLDRVVCTVLPIAERPPCPFEIDYDARSIEQGVACPSDVTTHKGEKCDSWQFIDMDDSMVTITVLTGTTTPVKAVHDGDHYKEVYLVMSYDATEPDPRVFDIPADQPCVDLTVQPTAVKVDNSQEHETALVNSVENVKRSALGATTWMAAASERFNGMTVADVKKTIRSPNPITHARRWPVISSPVARKKPSSAPIPVEFDSRKAFGSCIGAIREQGSCGACWAFGASESLSDRFCIAGNWSANVPLAPQWLVSCFKDLDGCDGGYVGLTWLDLASKGAATEKCVPYEGINKACPKKCADGSEVQLMKPGRVYSEYVAFDPIATVQAIQRDIMEHGPQEACLWLFEDFMHYAGGVYQPNMASGLAGGHCTKLEGWGVDAQSGLPYWLVANSWGTKWGEQGRFRILRGANCCGIEDEVVSGIPLL